MAAEGPFVSRPRTTGWGESNGSAIRREKVHI